MIVCSTFLRPTDQKEFSSSINLQFFISFTTLTMEISQRKEYVSRLHHHDGTTLERPPRMILRETVPNGECIGGGTSRRTMYRVYTQSFCLVDPCHFHMYLDSCTVWSKTTDLLSSTTDTEAIKTTHKSKN